MMHKQGGSSGYSKSGKYPMYNNQSMNLASGQTFVSSMRNTHNDNQNTSSRINLKSGGGGKVGSSGGMAR